MGASPAIGPAVEPQAWSRPRQIALRFVLAYVVLYCFPSPLEAVPYVEDLATHYTTAKHHAASWLGEVALGVHADPDTPYNGSGDRTIDYLVTLLNLVLATAITIGWTVLAHRRRPPPREHRRLAKALHVYLRYLMLFTMFGYGFAKLCLSQFPPLSPARLDQAYGDSTPMGMLWAFMSSSAAYTMLTGAVEVVGGLLLLWRRTTTLGALVIAVAMINIVALNFCYDVPVKQYSVHLLLFAVLIAGPDLGRLVDVLILHRPTTPAAPDPPLRAPWLRRARVAAKVIILLWATYFCYDQASESHRMRTTVPPALAPFYDAFEVESHQIAGVEVLDDARWLTLASGRVGYVWVKRRAKPTQRYGVEADPSAKLLRFTVAYAPVGTKPEAFALAYSLPDPEHVVLEGAFEGVPLRVALRRKSTHWPLVNTGFHWINEFPNNR
jgi:hypothetical protein